MIERSAVLFYNCAAIWLAKGVKLPRTTVTAIVYAGLANGMFLSTAAAWQIGLLSRPRPEPHPGPADRLTTTTARHLGMPIVTSDRKVLAYAEAGFVRAIPC